ncbi:MAG: ATP-binding protein [Candidatus Nanopelagicales bacterium]|nr:ATP-binding protein [Candidatus Nanopelagicales bacterium]
MAPRRIGLIGAECTGKSALAEALAGELDAVVVPEYLRQFVLERGRTPHESEQSMILQAQEQAEAEAAAATVKSTVIGDPAPLMTAVYSRAYFDDSSLLERALSHARGYDLLVWCDTDVAWLADGLQRDGESERARVHLILADILADTFVDNQDTTPASAGTMPLLVSGDLASRVAAVKRVWLPESPGAST